MTYPITDEVNQVLAIAKSGCHEILVEEEFMQKLAYSIATKIPLRVKLGFDPTAPDIHIGHTIVLNKMRELQDLGHAVIFLIGDFTSLIGDPSGRNKTRPSLTPEQIEYNAKTYFEQVALILDIARMEVHHNSQWLMKLESDRLIRIASGVTLARVLERDDFTRRFQKKTPIGVHELLYPLMQGYDSVVLHADLELGGTDQKFNLLMGRELQKQYGQLQQCILTMPLLEGLDGVEKMSKSKGNYIGVTDLPNDMFGKIMSISDELMWRYYDLISLEPRSAIDSYKKSVELGANPRDYKVKLAKNIVSRFHSHRAAEEAFKEFNVRARGGIPDNIPTVTLNGAPIGITRLLKNTQLVSSTSEATRKIEQNAVRIDGIKISDRTLKINAGEYIIQVGKRCFARVNLRS